MTRRTAILLCTLVALSLAGCMQDAPPSDSTPPTDEESPEESPSNQATPGNATGDVPVLPFLVAEDCVLWDLALVVPVALNPGQPPQGMAPLQSSPLSRITYLGFDCLRVAFAHLDRGPIRFIIEAHTNLEVPEACLPQAVGASMWALTSVVTDDQDFADALTATGIQAQLATIGRDNQETAALTEEQWHWTGPQGIAATANIVHDGTEDAQGRPPMRWFWADASGIQAADVDFDLQQPLVTGRPGVFTFGEDHLLGQIFPAVAAAMTWHPDAGMGASFLDMEGLDCESGS